jgi:thioredoxin 1
MEMKPWIMGLMALLASLQFSLANAESMPFTQAAFDRLMAEGKPVLLEVHADWCSTCRKQAPITQSLLSQNEFSALTALRVDYDKQKEVLKALDVRKQSTLIVFKSGKEVGRSIAETSPAGIESLIRRGL